MWFTLYFQDLLEKRRSAKKLKHTSFCSSIVDALVEMTYELVSLKVRFQPEVPSDVPPEVSPEVEPEVTVILRKKLTIVYQEESFES